jgi:hypothetical protein
MMVTKRFLDLTKKSKKNSLEERLQALRLRHLVEDPIVQTPEVEMNSPTGLLPAEVLIEIFKNLSLKELARAANVCRRWRKIADDVRTSTLSI